MKRQLIDITRTIGSDTLTYPGDKGAELRSNVDDSAGNYWEVTSLALSCHTGTHLDAPAHAIRGGRRLDEWKLDRLVFDAVVIDTGGAECVLPQHLEGVSLDPGSAVLFKTANGMLPRDRFTEEFCYISGEAAQVLIDSRIGLAGIDYLSVDPADSRDFPAHKLLLGAGVLILEDADLRAVQPGKYTLYCFPLKLHSTEAAPCRAALEPI